MPILPLLLRSVLFWCSVFSFKVYEHTCVVPLAIEDKQLAGRYRLVFQYAPAVLCLGIMVRDCSWYHCTPGAGDAARWCLHILLYLILKLNPQHRDGG